jgi:hypothetical protein
MSKPPTVIELDMDELEEILRRAEARQLIDQDYETIVSFRQACKTF